MSWAKGIVEWIEGDDAFISVVFSWDIEEAWTRARWLHTAGYRVRVGGPGVFVASDGVKAVREFAQVGGSIPDAVVRHNPRATFASRGCPVNCWFCIVPAMEGREFTMIDDFPVRPILCDNNLSALPTEFQDHIVRRYQGAEMKIEDAQSGFEPAKFTEETYRRWEPVMRGPWRFACDDAGDVPDVRRVLDLLREPVPNNRRKRVYVLIGNDPFDECMERIRLVLDGGGEPHVQPLIKLNAPTKTPWVRHDWSEKKLRDVARWANRRLWKYCSFDEYDRKAADAGRRR